MSESYEKLRAQKDAILAKRRVRIIHVIPVGDSGPSIHDALLSCWCSPLLDESEGKRSVIHNAHDCREKFERQGHAQQPWILIGGEIDKDSLRQELEKMRGEELE